MNKYEAMIIFRESLKDADWDGAVETVRGEIEKLGGTVSSCTRLGRREFARPMQKQHSGHYGLVAFELDGDKVGPNAGAPEAERGRVPRAGRGRRRPRRPRRTRSFIDRPRMRKSC